MVLITSAMQLFMYWLSRGQSKRFAYATDNVINTTVV